MEGGGGVVINQGLKEKVEEERVQMHNITLKVQLGLEILTDGHRDGSKSNFLLPPCKMREGSVVTNGDIYSIFRGGIVAGAVKKYKWI